MTVTAVRGGWTTPPLKIRIGNIIKGAKFEDKSAATAFAVPIAKALKAEALKAGIAEVAFDRSGFRYHGRVKAVAEAAREAGLKF